MMGGLLNCRSFVRQEEPNGDSFHVIMLVF